MAGCQEDNRKCRPVCLLSDDGSVHPAAAGQNTGRNSNRLEWQEGGEEDDNRRGGEDRAKYNRSYSFIRPTYYISKIDHTVEHA